MPATSQPSSSTTARLVFRTDVVIASMSMGRTVRRSTTSTLIPSLASSSAAFMATSTILPCVMIEQ
jgi:hypothetical protein